MRKLCENCGQYTVEYNANLGKEVCTDRECTDLYGFSQDGDTYEESYGFWYDDEEK